LLAPALQGEFGIPTLLIQAQTMPASYPYLWVIRPIDISIWRSDTRSGLGRFRFLGPVLAMLVLGGQAMSGIPALAASPATPVVVQSLKHDVSPPLRTLHASPVPPEGKGSQPRRPLRPGQSGPGVPTASKSIQMTAGASSMPSASTNFEGVNNVDNVLPPDTNGDVGPNDYVQWANLHFEIFDRTGASRMGPSAGNTLWSGFGGLCEFTNQGDPVVRYDRMANRWVFTQFAFTTKRGLPIAPYDQCFAVSTSGNPTGSYFRYAWQISNTNFPDYPKLAVWPDAYYMSVNFFSSNLTTFVGAGTLAFDRNKMLTNQSPTAILFGPIGSNYGGLLPSDLDGSILPPSGSPNYFGAIDTATSPSGSTFQIWKFHVDFITPANSTFGTASLTPNFNLPVDTYFWSMCGGSRSCIQQPGTSQGLDALSDRLMNRLQYRRFADGHESLVANHTVGVGSGGNQGAVRWYEIRGLSTTPTIYQQGTYAPSSDSRWMGSIAMDQAGDIAVGYSVSSTTISPSIRYTGRLAGDPLGTLPQGEATLISGSGSQTSTFSRWGDYSMMAVDPTDDCTFWYTQEYYTVTSDRGWQTRVGSFHFPSCGAPLTITNVQASNISANSAVVTWHTNNPANSRVDYGMTTTYGSSVTDSTSVTSHSMPISGLANNATFHYKVTSADGFGQIAVSSDRTFATYANLLNNGGFETGAAGWNLAPQATIDTSPADAHSGNNSLELIATAPWQQSWQAMSLSPAQNYSFTAWGRSSSAGGDFALISYDANWNETGPHINLTFAGAGTWTGVAFIYQPPAGTARVVVEATTSAAGTFWFDDIGLASS